MGVGTEEPGGVEAPDPAPASQRMLLACAYRPFQASAVAAACSSVSAT